MPSHDRSAILRTCEVLFLPGQVVELRGLEAVTSAWRRPHTVSGYFDDWATLAAASVELQARGIYATLNPVKPDLLARANNRLRDMSAGDPATSDADVVARRWLPIDCDPVWPSGISATDAEHAAALARAQEIRDYLASRGWPDPLLADSGNGAHLLYRVDLPPDDGGLVEGVLAALAFRFSDEQVAVDQKNFHPARIWKLYGTLAAKGDPTPDRIVSAACSTHRRELRRCPQRNWPRWSRSCRLNQWRKPRLAPSRHDATGCRRAPLISRRGSRTTVWTCERSRTGAAAGAGFSTSVPGTRTTATGRPSSCSSPRARSRRVVTTMAAPAATGTRCATWWSPAGASGAGGTVWGAPNMICAAKGARWRRWRHPPALTSERALAAWSTASYVGAAVRATAPTCATVSSATRSRLRARACGSRWRPATAAARRLYSTRTRPRSTSMR